MQLCLVFTATLPRRAYQYHTCRTIKRLRELRPDHTCRQLAGLLGLRLGQVQELCKSYGIRKRRP